MFSGAISVYGHRLNLPSVVANPFDSRRKDLKNICRFNFSQLCDEAVGAADYIALAQLFDVIFIDRVPLLELQFRNQVHAMVDYIFLFKKEKQL